MRIALFACLLASPAATAAQSTAAPPTLSHDQEVRLAKSAAPASISGEATVYALQNGQYRVAVEGTSGVACMVSRSQPLSLEPICYDPEGARTVMAIEIAQVEMRLRGEEPEEVERNIDAMIEAGELALPSRPTLAYMMSSGQVLYSDAETRVGSWHPHVHIYWPFATEEQFGALGQSAGDGVTIANPGKRNATLVLVAKDFVDPTG